LLGDFREGLKGSSSRATDALYGVREFGYCSQATFSRLPTHCGAIEGLDIGSRLRKCVAAMGKAFKSQGLVWALTLVCLVFADAVTMNKFRTRPVVVVGGGPVGLASALMLDSLGFSDITVVERRSGASSFEASHSYLYLIDARGQLCTDYLNITESLAMKAVGSSTFTKLTEFQTSGKLNSMKLPTLGKTAVEKLWMPRSVLLDALLLNIRSRSSIRVQFDTTVEEISCDNTEIHLTLDSKGKGKSKLATQLLVGCDGYRSEVRNFLALRARNTLEVPDDTNPFIPKLLDSPAAGLFYKMLSPKGDARVLSATTQAFAVRGTSKLFGEPRLSLGLLPVVAGAKRTANFIAASSHSVWKHRSLESMRTYLQSSFPQLEPLSDFFDDAEIARFAVAEPGTFPAPSYITKNSESLHLCGQQSFVVLAGDAVHSFPPDLGQGVNSGLHDVFALGQCLSKGLKLALMREEALVGGEISPSAAAEYERRRKGDQVAFIIGDNIQPTPKLSEKNVEADEQLGAWAIEAPHVLTEALFEYEASRVDEAKELAQLMTYAFPYQYRQAPGRYALSMLNTLLRLGLNKLLPWVFHPPAFFMLQQDQPILDYKTINKLAHRTTRAILKSILAGFVIWYRGALPGVFQRLRTGVFDLVTCMLRF